MRVNPEKGMTFDLDVAENSTMYSPVSGPDVQTLPIVPVAYGHFYAGPHHFTERSAFRHIYQVFLTHSGRARFTLNGQIYTVTPDSVCFLDCGVNHRYETDGPLWEHEWVNFYGSGAEAYFRLISPNGFAIHSLNGNHSIPLIFRELSEHYNEQDNPGLVHTSTRLIQLLDALYSLVIEQERSKIDVRRGNVQLAIDHMHEHFAEHISLEDMASTAFMSKYHFSRVFKNYTGMSPCEYLNSIRLSHARTLLITSSLSVEEIAWQSGFMNSKNLIRSFKQTLGLTPGECRKNGGIWNVQPK